MRAQSCGTDLFSLVGGLTLGGSGQGCCLLGLSPNCAGATEPRAVLRWPQLLELEEIARCGNFQWENQMCRAGEKGRDGKFVSLLDV